MKISILLPDYDNDSLDVIWENNSKYDIEITSEEVYLSANKEGLISFAKQMLYLAYNDRLPKGSHVHYDPFFTGCNQEIVFTIVKKETD